MKTDSFLRCLESTVDEMNEFGLENGKSYRLRVGESYVAIEEHPVGREHVIRQAAWVSLVLFDRYSVTITNAMNESRMYVAELVDLIDEYAKTPLKKREAEKYYYVKVADGSFGYLNYRDGDYGVFEKDNELKKTKFTRSEIAKYLGTGDDKLLDMYIERFCEEVE